MSQEEDSQYLDSHDLFLIELPNGDCPQYLVTERILTVNPSDSAMGVPWSELAALFRGRTLRAVPLPGQSRSGSRSALRQPGVSTEPGVSTSVEVNLVKIGKGA